MIDLLRLCRLYYAAPLASILPLTIAYAHADASAEDWPQTLLATGALTLVVCGAYVLNDVCDVRVDVINAPQRPIAAGRVSRRAAAVWAGLLFLAGLGLSTSQRPAFVVTLATVTAGLVLYDVFSKRLGMVKPLAVAVLTTSVYPLAFAQVGVPSGERWPTLFVFPVWLLLTAVGYEILKDLRDVAGDQAVASPSWVARRPNAALRVARAALVAGGLVLIVPGFVGCGWMYEVIVVGAVGLAVATAFVSPPRAMVCVYAECVVVGIAATADLLMDG